MLSSLKAYPYEGFHLNDYSSVKSAVIQIGVRPVNEAQASNSRTVFLCIVRFSELTAIISQRECRKSPSHNMNPAARRQAEACQPATMFRKSPYNKYQ
jgi:hypothetical protein